MFICIQDKKSDRLIFWKYWKINAYKIKKDDRSVLSTVLGAYISKAFNLQVYRTLKIKDKTQDKKKNPQDEIIFIWAINPKEVFFFQRDIF